MSGLAPTPKDSGKKPRPYWHVDAKWVSGILLGGILALWLLLVVAWQITQRDTAVTLMTSMVTAGMKTGDDESNRRALESLAAQIDESPTKAIQPLPGFPATITEADLQLGAAGIRDKLFRQVVEPIYDKGARKVAEEQTSDKAAQDKFVKDASALSILSRENHERIGVWVLVGGLVVALAVAATAFFSYRFGRIVAPALVALVVGLPGLAVFSMLRAFTGQPVDPAAEVTSYADLALQTKGAFEPAAIAAQQVYVVVVLVALGLLAAALLARTAYGFIRKPGASGRV